MSSKRSEGFMGSLIGGRRSSSKADSSSKRSSSYSSVDSLGKSGFFSRSKTRDTKDVSSVMGTDTSSFEVPISRVTTQSSSLSTSRNSVYTLSSSHAKKLAGSSFKKVHRHTLSDEFQLEPPDSIEEIEQLFDEVMASRDFGSLPEKARHQMEGYSPDRKWMLIRQHKLAEFKKEKLKEQESSSLVSPKRHSTISAGGSSRNSKNLQQRNIQQQQQQESLIRNSDPSFYVGQLISNEISLEQLKELDICLSSEEITWTQEFLHQEGALCLCNVLNNLYKTSPILPVKGRREVVERQAEDLSGPVARKLFTNISEEYDSVLEKETRLFRCIKVIADLTIGIEDLKKSDIFIQSIFGGLYSCKPLVRKWATDIITYFYHRTSYSDTIYNTMHRVMNKNVHFQFIQLLYSRPGAMGLLDQRSQYILGNRDKVKRYEVWLWGVSRLFEGRGRMGSKVGAFQEFRYSGPISDNFLAEYALSTLLLINTLVQKSGNLAQRTRMRRLFLSAGVRDIFECFRRLNNVEINHSIASIDASEQEDQAELRQMEEFKNENINFNDPVSLFSSMWKKSRNTEAGRHLLSMMQNIFVSQSGSLTSADPKQVSRNLKLVDSFINSITLASGDDDTDMNISINKLIASYHSDEIARKAVAEAAEAKKKVEEAEAEKDIALQQLNEGSKGVVEDMKSELVERSLILTRLREKLDERDKEVSELKRKRILDKHQQEMEMREMLLLLHSYQGLNGNNLGNSNALPMSSRIKELTYPGESSTVSELEKILQTRVDQSKMESRRLGSTGVEPSARLRDLRLKMDLLEREARDLENMDFEEFSEQIPEPPAKTDRQMDLETLAALRKKLDLLQRDANKVIKVQGALSQREGMQTRKAEALDRLDKLQKYMEDLKVRESEEMLKQRKTLDPRYQSSNQRASQLQKELDYIEQLCMTLKEQVASAGDDRVPGSVVAATGTVPNAGDLLSKFEDRYSKGKKAQPKADFSVSATQSIPVKKIDRESMRPFLGELETKVARKAAIDESVDESVSPVSGKAPRTQMPLSAIPLTPAEVASRAKEGGGKKTSKRVSQKGHHSNIPLTQRSVRSVSRSSQASVNEGTEKNSLYTTSAVSIGVSEPNNDVTTVAVSSAEPSSTQLSSAGITSRSTHRLDVATETMSNSDEESVSDSPFRGQSRAAKNVNHQHRHRRKEISTESMSSFSSSSSSSAPLVSAKSSPVKQKIKQVHVLDENPVGEVSFQETSLPAILPPKETPLPDVSLETANRILAKQSSLKDEVSLEENLLPEAEHAGDDAIVVGLKQRKKEARLPVVPIKNASVPSPPPLPKSLTGDEKSLEKASEQNPSEESMPPPPPPLPPAMIEKSSPIPPPPPPPPMFAKSASSPIPPPPPPVFPKSGSSSPIPPPPPLPSGKSRTPSPTPSPIMEVGPFDMLPRPKKKLKQLHWEKLEDTEDSFWANMGSEDMARKLLRSGVFDEIEIIFAAKEAKRIAKKRKEEANKITFLKTDVSQQFGICLHSFSSLSDEAVVLTILHCDMDVLDKPALLEFLAKPELNEISINLTKNFDPYSTDWQSGQPQKPEKDPSDLARADRIYLELIYNLHHYWRSRMRALNTALTYEKDYDDLVRKLETIDTALDRLEKSDTLRRVFDVILIVGNYMNDTSKQALGFKLSTLQRLNFLKDGKNTLSFLHYVEKIIHKNYPELEQFVNDLRPTFAASKISIEQTKTDCNLFISTVKNIDSSLQNGNLSNPDKFHPEDRFLKVVLRRLPAARSKSELLDDRAKIVLERFDKLMQYFGEDPSSDEFTRNTFFSKFSEFVQSFEKAAKENRETEERNRLYDLSMQRLNQEREKEKRDAEGDSKTKNSDMDKFLEQLRQTGPLRSEPTSAKIREWAKKHSAKGQGGQEASETSIQEVPGLEPLSEASESTLDLPGDDEEEENIRNRTHDLLMKLAQQNQGGSSAQSSASASNTDLQFRLSDFKLSERMKKRLQQTSRNSSVSSLDAESVSRSGSYYTSRSRLDIDTFPVMEGVSEFEKSKMDDDDGDTDVDN
ncbi:DEKNAAC104907 [Brettanomyces naardenensis]|uniref:DEKNAAC104907 n=1 Tax=Brettanomyces naardenensis TaxID=13370 RepID=A0A448YRY7_BRENA|nr:DEKNAAC104907 [Brettanomyces naardenensis]